ncbi:MAG: LptF/LptG family permease, partial [Pseudomonadota bacterium]
RYIIKRILFISLSSTGILSLLVCLIQSLRFVDLMASGHMDFSLFLTTLIFLMPLFISGTLPLALFGAIIFSYYHLERNNEIVAMRIAGLHDLNLAKPALLSAFITMLCIALLDIWIVPLCEAAAKQKQIIARSAIGVSLLKEGEFNRIDKHLIVYFASRDSNHILQKIFIQNTQEDENPRTLFAKTGQIIISNDQPIILLKDGVQQYQDHNKNWHSVNFDEYFLSIQPNQNSDRVWRKPSVRSTKELIELPDIESLSPSQIQQMKAELHHRLGSPLRIMALAMIATICILCAPFNRISGNQVWLFSGILGAVVIVLADFLLISIARKQEYGSILIYLFNIMTIVGGLLFYLKRIKSRQIFKVSTMTNAS